ncbi:gluconate 2-dehydrogenase [Lentibacillus persicus]|uniref:Gluconate 2-dehydrogenase n=1 Tax=Lentibacillus persicus TaxID=640948 RepID=A0A1I2A339_9BACI|nr:D-glycerate dehydrogenase [Lentibacillus persicus]SFE38206.1 gluconate 2-dehydrogenase [Lentibacillus persicus]
MKPKVILYNQISEDLVQQMEKYCDVVKLSTDEERFSAEIPTAKGIIGSGLNVDIKLLNQAPELQIVTNISAGYDNLDLVELERRGIFATNTPDVLNETTADTVFGLMISASRRMPELDAYVKAGKWQSKITEEHFGMDIHHKTLGIIGMGRIGMAVAERAHFGFKMNVLYHNRSRKPEAEAYLKAEYAAFDDLLMQSDFVCLMAPLTPDTVNLIGKREFSLMKETGIFVNGARGTMVVESDLIDALRNGDIMAAGLDVYQNEPVEAANPLLKMDNVVTMPHIGSATRETRYKMGIIAVQNLIQGLNGEVPVNQIHER